MMMMIMETPICKYMKVGLRERQLRGDVDLRRGLTPVKWNHILEKCELRFQLTDFCNSSSRLLQILIVVIHAPVRRMPLNSLYKTGLSGTTGPMASIPKGS